MIRLQKLLAGAGLASRRTVEEWIRSGRVTVAGRIAQPGDRASHSDEVRLDGRKLELGSGTAAAELLLYYKPVGEVTTRRDPQRRPTVFDRLPRPAQGGRWISVGRLDVNTSGLLLLTTDGELAHRLMHPSGGIEREYLVRVRGRPGPEALRQLREGVPLEDGPAHFDSISAAPAAARSGSHSAFRVVLREGRKREVRRLWQALGLEVSRLLRIRYGPIELPRDLHPGGARAAGPQELEALRASLPRGGGHRAGNGGPAAGRGSAQPGGGAPASK
ncbi:MAG TPA: pseudouridine synthase [Steroidobacteraceae bacterium]|jgi:23S rRNA pseudouridine2605 synthase|nr:pseudouridine synthase [Steroidobacteraceae bacterium]